MTTAEATETTTETVAKESTRITLPKSIADLQALTHIPTTEATSSFGAFVNKYITNADNFSGISPEQAWTVIGAHRVWQSSEERKAEIAELKVAAAEAEQKRKEELEIKKAERAEAAKAAEAKKAAAKAKKEADKAAKEEAGETNDDDLDDADDTAEDGATAAPKKTRRRPAAKATGTSTGSF